MAITFRYNAAAVVPPSNESTRKYGQNLVLQQQQQKYQEQQAGYDRMFQLGKDNLQNQFQLGRDNQLNQFQVGRDKALFDQQQQQAEADRQRQFMDEARKQSSAVIMGDIEGGLYDPSTSRKLKQSLIDEAEVLGNPNLDATQRAEALAKLRATRSMLTMNRQEKPPAPTPDEELRGAIQHFNGVPMQKDKDGIWQRVNLEESQGGGQGGSGKQAPQRPTDRKSVV